MTEDEKKGGDSQQVLNALTSHEFKTISFRSIAEGRNEVLIEHNGEIYRLRLTRNDKLILNK